LGDAFFYLFALPSAFLRGFFFTGCHERLVRGSRKIERFAVLLCAGTLRQRRSKLALRFPIRTVQLTRGAESFRPKSCLLLATAEDKYGKCRIAKANFFICRGSIW
jgi:hypothetical protein